MPWPILLLLGLLAGCSFREERTWTSPRITIQASERGDVIAGEWRANADAFGSSPFTAGTWVTIEIDQTADRGKQTLGLRVEKVDGLLRALKEGGPDVSFGITADAGELAFDGSRDASVYRGSFQFRPNILFRIGAEELLASAPTPWDLMELAILDVDLGFIRSLASNPEERFTTREIIRARHAGVSADYARQMHAAGIQKMDDIVRLRQSGVNVEMVSGLRDAGFSLNAEEIVRLRHAGVSPEYAAAWKQSDFDFSVDDIVSLRRSGASQDYGSALKASGSDWTAEQIVHLRRAGASPDYVAALRSSAPSLKAEEIVQLRRAGVSPDYFTAWARNGYNQAADVVRLRHAGVQPSYAEELNIPGREPLPVEAIVEFHHRGVSPAIARKLLQLRQ